MLYSLRPDPELLEQKLFLEYFLVFFKSFFEEFGVGVRGGNL